MFVYVYKPGDPPAACFRVEPETTYGQLKEIVAGAFGVKPEAVKLTRHCGAAVTAGDADTLQAAGIKHKELFHLVA